MVEHRPGNAKNQNGVVLVGGKRDRSLEGLGGEEIAKALRRRRSPAVTARAKLAAGIKKREDELDRALKLVGD